jgi:aspartyl-tRNA(Asn)/glutamyl-tRNA(Gln) amidotransferase subunit B
VSYEAVIGLEVHAQLRTRSKMFCACAWDPAAPPNTRVCPVCLGHPGTLPVVNRRAVELGARFCLAVGARLRRESVWARKNYFYPDLPKGYQITQYDRPLAEGGEVRLDAGRAVRLVRLHLEEDAGRSRHPEREGETRTRVDLNRCGVPLLEIVTAPDLRSPAEAHAFLAELRQLLRYCEVCDGDMEKGSLRCDANVSVRPRGATGLGAKTELKNLNSLRQVERALAFEIGRQGAELGRGGAVAPATLQWDPERGEARVLRTKEDAPDYRYFPEPDLPPLRLDEAFVASLGPQVPELPRARRERLEREHGLPAREAEVLTATRELADYFERVVAQGAEARGAARFIASELLGALHDRGAEVGGSPVGPAALAELLGLIGAGRVSHSLGKRVLAEMLETGRPAGAIVSAHGWERIDDAERIAAWAAEAIRAHPGEAAACRAGKAGLLEFFVGQVLQRSGGQAHPERVRETLRRALTDAGDGEVGT